jgi:hypothetical protein
MTARLSRRAVALLIRQDQYVITSGTAASDAHCLFGSFTAEIARLPTA